MMRGDHIKQLKLKLHPATSHDEDLIFNSSDLPKVKQHDLLKVFQNDNSSNFMLFQVKTLKDGVVPKDCVSIEQSLASKIGLQVFHDVYIFQVEPEDVTIDLLEVSFKEQYISRSDMWRMKKHLANSCVYIDQHLQFTDIRAQVSELWVNSTKSRCGFISDSTNIVLRSFTAKVYVFIQMSSEMWAYDSYGYLQFERAIDGFLKALFTKWKEKKCCHELTLVLFSRTFYATQEVSDFPEYLQQTVREDYQGRLYLDFYKCVVQSEKLEDCTPLLNKLKKLVHKYDELTQLEGCPKGSNSKSAEGNFLEAINMSLNVFERHNIDRNFDGTGQIVVCITPGVGVFDVNRDLTILTKERMIDNGIGSDLICLGQQPLHAVPLFKFHQKQSERARNPKSKASKTSNHLCQYDFNIPHWINHSFYTSNPFSDKGTTNINFIPRIHIPALQPAKLTRKMSSSFSTKPVPTESESLPTIQQLSFDEYDKQIFGLNKSALPVNSKSGDFQKNPIPDHSKKKLLKAGDNARPMSPENKRRRSRPVHIPLKSHGLARIQDGLTSSLGAVGNAHKQYFKQKEDGKEIRAVIGSASLTRKSTLEGEMSAPLPRRALFNPFNPLQMFAPLTANRRRWIHTYPRGPQGEAMVLHHRNSSLTRLRGLNHRESESTDDESIVHPFAGMSSSPIPSSIVASSPVSTCYSSQCTIVASGSFDDSSSTTKATSFDSNTSNRATTMGCLGDYVDSSSGEGGFVTYKGLDWKSLKCPACLPITTDYCPQQSHLRSAYTEHSYTLVPDTNEKIDDEGKLKADGCEKDYRSAREVFFELLNQRLCQGFQLIKQSKRIRNADSNSSCATMTSPATNDGSYRSLIPGTSPLYTLNSTPGTGIEGDPRSNSFMLSHGRQYHVLRMTTGDDKIEVKVYKQKHPSPTVIIDYDYMLWPKTRSQFQIALTSFSHKTAEDSYWNHLDDYVCCPDDSVLKNKFYWRTKFVAVAAPNKKFHILKSANENNKGPTRYDVFTSCGCKTTHKNSIENGECGALTDGFARFLEHINKFKRSRTNSTKKSTKSSSSFLSKSYQTPTSSGGASASTPTPPRATSSTPPSQRATPVRMGPESSTNGPPPVLSGNLMHRVDIQQPVPLKHNEGSQLRCNTPCNHITINSEMSDIIEAMKDTQSGISFLVERNGIPKYTFISLDAVHWAIDNVDGISNIKDACDHFERLRSYGFLSHVTWDNTATFTYGFMLYTLNQQQQSFELEDPSSYQFRDMSPHSGCEKQHHHWVEVAIKRDDLEESERSSHHNFSLSLDASQQQSGAFIVTPQRKQWKREKARPPATKLVMMSLPNKASTQRSEWCQIRHSAAARCGVDKFAFCFELQWLIATATYLFNMLQTWFRDAGRCDLYFFPVPCQPFAFPSAGATGPLRCPLFVPLHIKTLIDHSTVFEDHLQHPGKYRDVVIAMMERILHRFGFVRDEYYSDAEEFIPMQTEDSSENFVHFTGQLLAQIPIHSRSVHRNSICARHRKPCKNDDSAHAQPITDEELDSTGFYLTFNYMQTKRWRHALLDECPPADLERDFVSFCSNSDMRLINFFDEFMNGV